MVSSPVILVDGVSKTFGSTLALSNVSMAVAQRESRALIGNNGAGKSTLVAILTGLLHADSGSVTVAGQDQERGSLFSGVGCVYQRSTLIPAASAAENIALARYPTRRLGLINWSEVHDLALDLLDDWGCRHLAGAPVEALDPLERKIVEICRVLALGPKILLLDEPTAGLDATATRHMFEQIEQARGRGVTIIYVSHHLQEVFEVCDSVTVLRDGQVVMADSLQGLSVHDLVSAMLGDSEDTASALEAAQREERGAADAPVVLKARDLSCPKVESFSIELKRGECVGLTGLDGSGHVQVAEILTGQRKPDRGTVVLNGSVLPLGDVRGCIKAGVGFCPEDRHADGYVPAMSVAENSTFTILHRFVNRLRFINRSQRDRFYEGLAQDWKIKAWGPDQMTEELSGGNQQKVVLARSVASSPYVLILVNPTAGVDVGAKQSIYTTIGEITGKGHAVLVVTSDDSDLQICDRALVMFQGRVNAEYRPPFLDSVLAAAVQGSPLPVSKPGGDGGSA